MTAKVEDGYHIHLPCTFNRTTPFEIDFSGVFLYFTVSPLFWMLAVICAHSALTMCHIALPGKSIAHANTVSHHDVSSTSLMQILCSTWGV